MDTARGAWEANKKYLSMGQHGSRYDGFGQTVEDSVRNLLLSVRYYHDTLAVYRRIRGTPNDDGVSSTGPYYIISNGYQCIITIDVKRQDPGDVYRAFAYV